MAEKIALDIQISTLNSAESIGALKNGIKELTKELEKLPEGSEQFKNTAAAIGNAKDKLADLNEEVVQTTTKAGKFQAVLGIGQQIANGIQLAQSAMALFGSESEQVQKALEKAQAAMQFVQGLKELEGIGDAMKNAKVVILDFAKNGITALRSLWAAMLSNPITAILVGLTALAGAIAYLMTRESEETKALRENINERQKSIDAIDREKEVAARNAKFRLDLAKAQGKSEKELFEIEQDTRKKREKEIEKENNLYKEQFLQLNKLRKDADDDEQADLVKQMNDLRAKIVKNNDEKIQLENDFQIKKATLATADIKKEEDKLKEQQAKAKEAAKQREENRKAEEEKIKADLERNRVEELKNLENQRKAKELDGTLTYEDKKKYYDDVYQLEIQKSGLIAEDLEELRLKHLENLKNLDAEEQKRKEEQAAKDKELADKKLADEIAAEEEYDEYIKDIEAKRLARKTAIKEAELNLVTDTLKLTADIATAFAKDDEASQKKAFEINKKVQLALATIEMIKGVQSAFTSAQGSPYTAVFPGYPYIQAAMAAAYGIMNIRKIQQTQFEGGGGGAAGGMEGAAGGAGGAMSAPLQGGVNNTSTMLENLGQGQQEQKPIKAYVLQTDVASEDQKIKAIENKSKIE